MGTDSWMENRMTVSGRELGGRRIEQKGQRTHGHG